jgi:hypothetical protein
MCPVCIATAAWIAASATSTGGISALVVNRIGGRLRGKNQETTISKKSIEQGERHGEDQGD